MLLKQDGLFAETTDPIKPELEKRSFDLLPKKPPRERDAVQPKEDAIAATH